MEYQIPTNDFSEKVRQDLKQFNLVGISVRKGTGKMRSYLYIGLSDDRLAKGELLTNEELDCIYFEILSKYEGLNQEGLFFNLEELNNGNRIGIFALFPDKLILYSPPKKNNWRVFTGSVGYGDDSNFNWSGVNSFITSINPSSAITLTGSFLHPTVVGISNSPLYDPTDSLAI